MCKVYLICGKICSGKTYLSHHLVNETGAVRLSVDETMLAMNPTGLFGDKHDEIARKVQKELFSKSLELVKNGQSVILDWGFWTQKARHEASLFYNQNSVPYEWHYMDISDERWEQNIIQRNRAISARLEVGFIVDEGLRRKLLESFDPPSRKDIDVWHTDKFSLNE